MSLKSRLRPLYKSARTYKSATAPSRKPLVTVYGNCQAGALAKMLRSSPEFLTRYNVAWLPGAHEILARDLPAVKMTLARTSVLLTQNIRDNYRGMPLGTAEICALLRPQVRVLTFPSMFYRGLHPYLVYVHASGELGTLAPLTEGYHDLRFIAAAAQGMSVAEAAEWLTRFEGSTEWIQRSAEESLAELRRRESSLDVSIATSIIGDEAFWTLNHPSNAVLNVASQQIHEALDLVPRPWVGPELLGSTVVPLCRDVRKALGFGQAGEAPMWRVGGRRIREEEVLAAHLSFYYERTSVLNHARQEHAEALLAAGLV